MVLLLTSLRRRNKIERMLKKTREKEKNQAFRALLLRNWHMNKYLRSVYTCVEMQEATPTHNIISLRAMFAQYYNSAKGTSAKWLKDQRRGCQEGEGEHETTDNGFLMPFVLLFCKSLIQIGYFISRTFLFIDYIHEQQRCSSYSWKEYDVLEYMYSTYMQSCKMFWIWNAIDIQSEITYQYMKQRRKYLISKFNMQITELLSCIFYDTLCMSKKFKCYKGSIRE